MESLISIIIPVYNSEKYLSRCLDSVINQTYKNIEIICVNDGSTDSCIDILDEYSKKDNRIIVVTKENGGAVSARKEALKIAKGEYIGCVDSDDWVELDMYEHMIDSMLKHNVEMVSINYISEYQDSSVRSELGIEGIYSKGGINEKSSFYHMFIEDKMSQMKITGMLWDKLVKKATMELYYTTIPEDIVFAEDCAYIYAFVPYIDSIYVSNKYCYHYNKINVLSVSQKMGQNINYIDDLFKVYLHLKSTYLNYEQKDFLNEQLAVFILKFLLIITPENIIENKVQYSVPENIASNYKKIIIYGAGNIGTEYYIDLKRHYRNVEITKIIDKNLYNQDLFGIIVENVCVLNTFIDYDIIIIAILDEYIANEIKRELISNYNIHEDRIVWEKPNKATIVKFPY